MTESQEKLLEVVDHTRKEVSKLAEVASKVQAQAQAGQGSSRFFVDTKKQEENSHNSSVLHDADKKIIHVENDLKTSFSVTEGPQSSSSPTR